jgi:hypothetical protein
MAPVRSGIRGTLYFDDSQTLASFQQSPWTKRGPFALNSIHSYVISG